jgi:hypothetical protein
VRAIGDQQLLLEKERLGQDCTGAAGLHESSNGDEKVDCENEEIAHRANTTISTVLYKTAANVPLRINS